MDVLQQHAAMIGGAATTSCPICHKLLIGTDALIEHMKYNHKDPNPPPSPLTSNSFVFITNVPAKELCARILFRIDLSL